VRLDERISRAFISIRWHPCVPCFRPNHHKRTLACTAFFSDFTTIEQSLVKAMEMALQAGKPDAAQLVATECVGFAAETKDHLNWELIGQIAEKGKGPEAKILKEAYDEVEEEEDEHLYHTTGWARELWIASLGLPAVLPPPEEEKDVKTAIGAARAKQSREKMVS
jgi:hypothetical protein